MIKAVIFDLDDTMYGHTQFYRQAHCAACRFLEAECGMRFGLVYKMALGLLKEKGSQYGRIYDDILKKNGVYSEGLLKKTIAAYRGVKPKLDLYSDLAVILPRLYRHYALGIITDGPVAVQRAKVRALGLKKYFRAIVYTDARGRAFRKPNPGPFRDVVRQLGVLPQEALFVGDNPAKDFKGAKKLGMRTMRILRGEYRAARGIHGAEADTNIKNYDGLMSFLEKNA